MGKRLKVQRRGRGTSVFRASTHKHVAPVRYPNQSKLDTPAKGSVERLLHDPGRGAPLAFIKCSNGTTFFNIACEGIHEGQEVEVGKGATPSLGNILPLGQIPEGTMIYNLEKLPNDGGKFARASGGYATIISHTPNATVVKLSSGKTAFLHSEARATIGVAAAAGRTEKPFMKAGEKFHLFKAKGHKYPTVRGVSMVSASHPFGGGRHKHPGKPTTVSRHAPPGRKVGLISAKQTGRAKKERRI